jgi:fluoride ion exporter CrcB/FEX
MNATPSAVANIAWVALGGAIGAALRYGVGEGARRIPLLSGFPWATLAITLIYGGQPLRALLHALASVVLSVAAIFVGYALARP